MQVLATTKHVAYGCPPRTFAVTVRQGDERVATVQCGQRRERFTWQGKGWRPNSTKVIESFIRAFLAAESRPGTVESTTSCSRRDGRPPRCSVPSPANAKRTIGNGRLPIAPEEVPCSPHQTNVAYSQ